MKVIFYKRDYKYLLLDFLLFVVAFSLPFSSAFNSIAIGIFFLYSFVFFEKNLFLKLLNTRKVYLYYMLFFFIQLGSIYYTSNKDIGLRNVIRNIVFLILPIAFVNLNNRLNKGSIKIIFFGLLISVCITLISAYFSVIYYVIFKGSEITLFIREKFIENGLYDIHAPYLALLIVFLLISTYSIKLVNDRTYNKILKIVIMFFLTLSLFQVSGLMSIFIFCLIVISIIIYSQKTIKARIIISSITIIFICTSFLLFKNLEKQYSLRGAENIIYRVQNLVNDKDSVRLENWKSVTKVISSNFFFGIGADGGLDLLQEHRDIMSEARVNKHNAHNDLLEIFLRYGLIGFSIYILILIMLIKNAILSKSALYKWYLVVFIIAGLTESYLQRQIGLVFFTFFSLLFYTIIDSFNEQLK